MGIGFSPGSRSLWTGFMPKKKPFLFLTNSSERSPRELQQKLGRLGLDIDESHFYTSALATAKFLKMQSRKRARLSLARRGSPMPFYEVGITMNDVDPEYVVVGETHNYNYDNISKAVQLVLAGAKLIGTNPDLTGPGETGIFPACGAMISPIEVATGKRAYFVGKPNPDDAHGNQDARPACAGGGDGRRPHGYGCGRRAGIGA